jgi:hypothetical protein
MLFSKRFLSDHQSPLQEKFRLRILPLVVVERREVVEAFSESRMLSAERFLSDDQRSFIKRFRLRIPPSCTKRLPGKFSLTQNPNGGTLRPLLGLPQTPHVSQTRQHLGRITGHYTHWAEILTYHRQTQTH